MTNFACAIAVGPNPQELDRVADLIDSLGAYEPGPWRIVMVDDSGIDRSLATLFDLPRGCSAVSVLHARPEESIHYRRGKGICSAVLTAFAHIARNVAEARFALKMDSDALIIAPFSEKIAGVIERNRDVGMLGAYTRTPNGEPRDFSAHASTLQAIYRPKGLLARFRPSPIRRHIRTAIDNGYRFAEQCIGGAYAVSDEFLRRMLAAGYLDNPMLWVTADCPEDVMVGMYTKAVGLRHMDFVGAGEAFGVRHQGLPDIPQRLLERGFSVIHSIKNDPRMNEAEIREFFRAHRRAGLTTGNGGTRGHHDD